MDAPDQSTDQLPPSEFAPIDLSTQTLDYGAAVAAIAVFETKLAEIHRLFAERFPAS